MSVALHLVAGFVALVAGAELLVRGASRVALALGLSPLVIGLTVVAVGTSAPELAVSVQASLNGQPEIALGNVVGSNIANVLLILGLAATITPLTVASQLIRWDVPLVVAVSVLVLVFALDGRIGHLEGALLLAGVVAYTVVSVREGRKAEDAEARAARPKSRTVVLHGLMVPAGLTLLVLGAGWMVDGATTLARLFGLSELVIGLTVVSVGTSLPEIATAVVASARGERDLAVGNVVGSNLYNILAILGVAALAAPGGLGVPAVALRFDIPVMIAVAVACLPVFITGNRINRWEGLLFLGYYVAYLTYLVLGAQHHDALPAFSAVMLEFVLPLTAVTLVVVLLAEMRRRWGAATPPTA